MYYIYKQKIKRFLYMGILKILFFPLYPLWWGLKKVYFAIFPPEDEFCEDEDRQDDEWS